MYIAPCCSCRYRSFLCRLSPALSLSLSLNVRCCLMSCALALAHSLRHPLVGMHMHDNLDLNGGRTAAPQPQKRGKGRERHKKRGGVTVTYSAAVRPRAWSPRQSDGEHHLYASRHVPKVSFRGATRRATITEIVIASECMGGDTVAGRAGARAGEGGEDPAAFSVPAATP